jgi:hypothetical protein
MRTNIAILEMLAWENDFVHESEISSISGDTSERSISDWQKEWETSQAWYEYRENYRENLWTMKERVYRQIDEAYDTRNEIKRYYAERLYYRFPEYSRAEYAF